ncbi:membrane hypothetical protein [Gammaproteobacteria bacterium]
MVEPQLPKLMAWVRFPSPAPNFLNSVITMRFFMPLLVALTFFLAEPVIVHAQSQSLPFIDQLTSPFTDTELSGVGCLAASATTGGILVYLMGGFSRIVASMQGVIPPIRVMEGAAAISFVFSSVCYIGSALAPVAMMTYTSIIDSFSNDLSTFLINEETTSSQSPRP